MKAKASGRDSSGPKVQEAAPRVNIEVPRGLLRTRMSARLTRGRLRGRDRFWRYLHAHQADIIGETCSFGELSDLR